MEHIEKIFLYELYIIQYAMLPLSHLFRCYGLTSTYFKGKLPNLNTSCYEQFRMFDVTPSTLEHRNCLCRPIQREIAPFVCNHLNNFSFLISSIVFFEEGSFGLNSPLIIFSLRSPEHRAFKGYNW